MQLLYNSDSFAVVRFDVAPSMDGGDHGSDVGGTRSDSATGTSGHTGAAAAAPRQGGYEIVDKFARKEIFLQGALADRFAAGVNELVAGASDEAAGVEALDEFISGFTGLAPQPLVVH